MGTTIGICSQILCTVLITPTMSQQCAFLDMMEHDLGNAFSAGFLLLCHFLDPISFLNIVEFILLCGHYLDTSHGISLPCQVSLHFGN